jgi:anti-sigma regulatory factor (Ser/Thr protein kinase)
MLVQDFTAGTLRMLREAVLAHASAAGLPESRATDVMLAVHELAANAVRHGGGTGRVHIRAVAGALRCQVTDPGAGPSGHRPADGAESDSSATAPWRFRPGHGLWLVRQTASQITVHTGPRGSQVTASFALT